MEIVLPHGFEPRDYQRPVFEALDAGVLRAVCVWHRRAGKDLTQLNIMIKKAMERVGAYHYYLPVAKEARRIIWKGMTNDGKKFTDYAPEIIRAKMNETEMSIELVNGSIIQIIGTNKFDGLRGANPVGVIFSEYAFQSPHVWAVVRPVLAMNGGWALFNSTPYGENHFFDLANFAKEDPSWFYQLLTVDDTKIISKEVLDQERKEMLPQEFMREYYCSFNAATEESYYLEEMKQVKQEGRIMQLPFDKEIPVDAYLDIGVSDHTAIWFKQSVGQRLNIPDYYQNTGKAARHYFEYMKHLITVERGGIIGTIYLPHDANNRNWGSELTPYQQAVAFFQPFGVRVEIVPKTSIASGIDAVRRIFHRVSFNAVTTVQGVACLNSYSRDYDKIRKVYKTTPKHDWASHGADGFRYLAVAVIMYEGENEETRIIKRTAGINARKLFSPI